MDVVVNVLVVRHGALVFTILVRRTARFQLGRLKVLDLLILDFIEILAADFDGTLLAEERDRSLHIAAEAIDRKIYAPDGAVVEFQDRNAGVLELYRTLVRIVVRERERLTHISHEPI